MPVASGAVVGTLAPAGRRPTAAGLIAFAHGTGPLLEFCGPAPIYAAGETLSIKINRNEDLQLLAYKPFSRNARTTDPPF